MLTNLLQHQSYGKSGQVAPELSANDERIAHLIFFVDSGLNQFYDNMISTRIKISGKEITREQRQKEIDELFKLLKDIYSDKNSTDKE